MEEEKDGGGEGRRRRRTEEEKDGGGQRRRRTEEEVKIERVKDNSRLAPFKERISVFHNMTSKNKPTVR